jgi:hypothetical protein
LHLGSIGYTSDPTRLETDYWFASSKDGGNTWSEIRVTPTSFDMDNAPNARGYFVGDYEGLVTVGTVFKAFFVQAENTPSTTNVYSSSIAP